MSDEEGGVFMGRNAVSHPSSKGVARRAHDASGEAHEARGKSNDAVSELPYQLFRFLEPHDPSLQPALVR